MLLRDAAPLAEHLLDAFGPFCVRIAIAGSLRRRKADVKDIELLLIPRFEAQPFADGLFVDTRPVNLLHAFATASPFQQEVGVQWIKPATADSVPWSIDAAGKYWRGYLPRHQIKLDVFLCGPWNWGNQLLLRTGAAEFGQAVVTHAKRVGMPFVDGRVLGKDGIPLYLAEERLVFSTLGLAYVEPEERTGADAVRLARPVRLELRKVTA